MLPPVIATLLRDICRQSLGHQAYVLAKLYDVSVKVQAESGKKAMLDIAR